MIRRNLTLAEAHAGTASCYWGHRGDWIIAVTRHRDSDDVERVNFDYMVRVCRERFVLDDDYAIERSSHFAVGWIDSLIINPANADLRWAIVDLWDRIDEYPCLDDDLLVQYEMAEDADDSSSGDDEKEFEDA